MDPVAFLWALLTGTSFGLPLLILVVAALIWLVAAPKANPPGLAPRPVWREPSPDPVSTIYWVIASGGLARPVHYLYQRWAGGIRARYGLYPWDIPSRKRKAQKLGITRSREILKLDRRLLDLYYAAVTMENRTQASFAGDLIWAKRLERHRERLRKALLEIQLELPELWGY